MYRPDVSIEVLIGKTLKAIYVTDDESRVTFAAEDGTEYQMYHDQDCCESVSLEDVAGEWNDLIGSPIVRAEENSSNSGREGDTEGWPEGVERPNYLECWEWTFYRIGTQKGTVVLRWYGTSNGYYGTGVSFKQTEGN